MTETIVTDDAQPPKEFDWQTFLIWGVIFWYFWRLTAT